MGVNIAQAPQAIRSRREATKVWQKRASSNADDQMGNSALAIDQHPNLPCNLRRQFAQVTRQLLRHDLLGGYFAAIDMLQTPDLV